jgi:hypothetical protein
MKASKLCLDLSDAPKVVEHLRVLSAQRRTSQKAIVVEALQQYFDRDQENEFIRRAADRTFAEWDNPDDAVYDRL